MRHEIIDAVRDFFNSRGFILTDTPIFTPAACEGTTTLFPVEYFDDQKAYLTQSGQLYIEATAMALGRVYCFGPTFRAEKSKTRRHLTEFWMVEPEMAYADLDDVMNLAEALVVSVVGARARQAPARAQGARARHGQARGHHDAVPADHLRRGGRAAAAPEGRPFEWGGDFGGPDETALSQQFDRPVMVHRYPAAIKAFYMKPDPERPELALGVDVLAPEGYGEIIGGGERLADLDLLLEADRGAQAAAGGLRVVSRPAALRHGAARRLRHGHRARGRLDLRPRARARDDPVSADAVSAVSVRC